MLLELPWSLSFHSFVNPKFELRTIHSKIWTQKTSSQEGQNIILWWVNVYSNQLQSEVIGLRHSWSKFTWIWETSAFIRLDREHYLSLFCDHSTPHNDALNVHNKSLECFQCKRWDPAPLWGTKSWRECLLL
jgi:hypothetical protein